MEMQHTLYVNIGEGASSYKISKTATAFCKKIKLHILKYRNIAIFV